MDLWHAQFLGSSHTMKFPRRADRRCLGYYRWQLLHRVEQEICGTVTCSLKMVVQSWHSVAPSTHMYSLPTLERIADCA